MQLSFQSCHAILLLILETLLRHQLKCVLNRHILNFLNWVNFKKFRIISLDQFHYPNTDYRRIEATLQFHEVETLKQHSFRFVWAIQIVLGLTLKNSERLLPAHAVIIVNRHTLIKSEFYKLVCFKTIPEQKLGCMSWIF